MSVEPESHLTHTQKENTRSPQIELPRSTGFKEVYDISSDEDYKLVSSPYKSESSINTTRTEGAQDVLFDSQENDVAKEHVPSPYNLCATKTDETEAQEESINAAAAKVNPIHNEEKDAQSSSGTQNQSSSRTCTSPNDHADTVEALNDAQQSTTDIPERNKPKNTQQKMKTTYQVYSNHEEDAILSVKLKLCHEGSRHQINHVDVRVNEDISPPSYYRRKEDNPRRTADDYAAKKRRRGQDLVSQSQPDRNIRGDSSSNRRSRHGTGHGTHEVHDGAVHKEVTSVAPGVLIIIATLLVCYCLMNNSEQPDTNQHKYRY